MWVFTPYITKKGKRIYHPTGGVFRFWVDDEENINSENETNE